MSTTTKTQNLNFANTVLNGSNNANISESRLLAISAGNLRQSITQEIVNIVTQKKRNFKAIAKEGASRLLKDGLITKTDMQNLNQIITLIANSQTQKGNTEKIKRIYDSMVLDQKTSSVALTIAGLSVSSGRISLPGDSLSNKVVAKMSRSNAADTGMVAGALAGAAIGGAIGGFGGAVIGAAIGGIVGGAVGLCTGD
jgi:hypothetical protein